MLDKVERAVLIILDGEPQGKGRPQFSTKTMRAFTPAKTRSYEAALRWAAQEAMRSRPPFEGPLQVLVTAHMPIASSWPKWKKHAADTGEWKAVGKPDIDNILKTLDAFNGLVWKDDAQIVEFVVKKVCSYKPSLTILVTPLRQATR